MSRILIVGANGQLARHTTAAFVSLDSLADLIAKLATTPGMECRHSTGVSDAT